MSPSSNATLDIWLYADEADIRFDFDEFGSIDLVVIGIADTTKAAKIIDLVEQKIRQLYPEMDHKARDRQIDGEHPNTLIHGNDGYFEFEDQVREILDA